MAHGGDDRLVSPAGSATFFDVVTFPDKQIQICPGGYHEPYNDIGHEQVRADDGN